jgi:uroporphyrinogen-III synthase
MRAAPIRRASEAAGAVARRKAQSQSRNKPLQGVRVLIGRAKHQAGSLSSELRKLGADVLEIPFIEIRSPDSFQKLDIALQNLAAYDWLILTSVNGVEAMWARMKKLRVTKKALGHLKIAAIGPATRKAIEAGGSGVDVVPKEYIAESVVKSLRRRVKGKRVLLVRAKVARDVIPNELRKAGAQVDVIEAYETVVPKSSRSQLRATLRSSRRRPHVITFTSSSTAKNFMTLLNGGARSSKKRPDHLKGISLASIGPVTSATLRQLHLGVDVEAKKYTIPGLIAAIVENARPR